MYIVLATIFGGIFGFLVMTGAFYLFESTLIACGAGIVITAIGAYFIGMICGRMQVNSVLKKFR